MSLFRQQDTSTEAALWRELYGCGLRYCVHVPVLTKPRGVADVWRSKILAYKERDLDTDRRLREDGRTGVRAWGHEVPSVVRSL